jgi:hypothetical protein
MKLLIPTIVVSLLLGTSAFPMQNQDDRDKDKPAPKEEPRKQGQPDRDRDRDRQQQDRDRQDRDRTQQQDRDRRDQDRDRAQQQDRDRKDQDRDRAQGQEHHNQSQRDDRNRVQTQDRGRQGGRQSAVRGRRIPDDRFHASFGREHSFHIQRGGGGRAGGDQRFQYGGYWFEYTDAWPDDWAYDDDFYIDYIDDDYYLYDRRHPGVHILVIVVE